jgi:large subunit ribosomal protein L3
MSTLEKNVRGLLGTKLGMTQTWDENNRVVPVTVVAAGTNVVTQVRQPETDGYNAVQIGFGEIEGRKVTKPQAGPLAQNLSRLATVVPLKLGLLAGVLQFYDAQD